MKRKTAKEILAESFRKVAETKPIDKITIRDIVDNCGYSPATFYRQFSDKYDLIAWDYVARTTVIIDKVGVDAYQWKHTWADGVKFYAENREYIFFLAVSKGTGLPDIDIRIQIIMGFHHDQIRAGLPVRLPVFTPERFAG